MKTANVVGVRDLGPLASSEAGLVKDDARVDQMTTLLRRYPALDEAEKTALLHFLKKGPQVEIGLVSAREGMAARIGQFRHDHRADFRLKPHEIAGFLALVLVPLLALVWICMP